MSYCSFLWGKKGERPFLFQVKEIRRGRGTRQSDGLLICPMYVKSLSINIYHFLGCFFFVFCQSVYTKKCIVCITYTAHIIPQYLLLHVWTNICINMIMSDVNFFFTSGFCPNPIRCRRHYIIYFDAICICFDTTFIYIDIMSSDLTECDPYPDILPRLRSGIQAPVHMWSAFFNSNFLII